MRSSLKRWAVHLSAGLLLTGVLAVQATAGAEDAQAVWNPPTDCRQTVNGVKPNRNSPVPAPPDNYTPVDGTIGLNNPLGTVGAKRVNTNMILRAINSTPTCESIRLATWNFRSLETADALRAAMARGVTVRVLMSAGNTGPKGSENYNKIWEDLKADITASNVDQTRPPEARNLATTCVRACRYGDGASHSKYYLFSKVGTTANVAFYGSHNLTDTAFKFQWNDLMTVVRPTFYTRMSAVFAESQPKQNQPNPYRRVNDGTVSMDVYPYVGAGRPSNTDPILQVLNRVKCTQAGSVGSAGRTVIRLNVAAILYSRGQVLGDKIASLKRQGCNIRVLVTNVGFTVMKSLQRAGVPLRQLAKYDDRERVYTYYTHTKFITISGNYNGRAGTQVAFNGSSNWTNSTLVSDELFGEVRGAAAVNAYNAHVNRWFSRTPMRSRVIPTTAIGNEERRSGDQFGGVERDF